MSRKRAVSEMIDRLALGTGPTAPSVDGAPGRRFQGAGEACPPDRQPIGEWRPGLTGQKRATDIRFDDSRICSSWNCNPQAPATSCLI